MVIGEDGGGHGGGSCGGGGWFAAVVFCGCSCGWCSGCVWRLWWLVAVAAVYRDGGGGWRRGGGVRTVVQIASDNDSGIRWLWL